MQQNTLNGDMLMLGITEFLKARIGEDEAAAKDVASEPAGPKWGNYFKEVLGASPVEGVGDMSTSEYAAHVARHDPARVLAECAAKRAIIRIAADQIRLGQEAGLWKNWEDMATQNLSAIASVYADHPDYQQEWAA